MPSPENGGFNSELFTPLVGKFDIDNLIETPQLPPRGVDPEMDALYDKEDELLAFYAQSERLTQIDPDGTHRYSPEV